MEKDFRHIFFNVGLPFNVCFSPHLRMKICIMLSNCYIHKMNGTIINFLIVFKGIWQV